MTITLRKSVVTLSGIATVALTALATSPLQAEDAMERRYEYRVQQQEEQRAIAQSRERMQDMQASSAPATVYPFPHRGGPSGLKRELLALGYSDVRDVTRNGNIYEADAQWNGRPLHLRIDARNGSIQATHDMAQSTAAGSVFSDALNTEASGRSGGSAVDEILPNRYFPLR